MATPSSDDHLPSDDTWDIPNAGTLRMMGDPWGKAGYDEAEHFIDAPGFDKPAELFMIMGDVARLSKTIDSITEQADKQSCGTIPESAYLDLARNVGPFRSWGNYIRAMDEQALEEVNYSAPEIGVLRKTLDACLVDMDRAYKYLQLAGNTEVGGQSYENSEHLRAAARYLASTGGWLSTFVDQLPASHRPADLNLPEHEAFKKDLVARPIRAMQSTCTKTLSALAAWDEQPVNGIAKSWGLWRDQESKLRRWGFGVIEGDAPLDSYDESKPIKECRFYLLRINYILNQDFMFFPATERYADRMITELSSCTPMGEFLNFVVDPKDAIDRATHTLFELTKTMAWRALDMKDDLSRWPNGHLWEASRAQVTRIGEGAERVIPIETILTRVLAVNASAVPGSAVPNVLEPIVESSRGQ